MLLFRGNETAKKAMLCTIEKSHSQIEKRFYYQTDDISWLEAKVKWKDVKSIGMVEKIIEKMTKFASKDATLFAKAVRGHWDIEVMHWYLDVLLKKIVIKY